MGSCTKIEEVIKQVNSSRVVLSEVEVSGVE